MKANERPINYDRPQDNYLGFEKAIKEHFDKVTSEYNHLYRVRVDTESLWRIYVDSLPEEGRFVYDCRCCKHFFERYGNLVVITDDGYIESALWNTEVPEFFSLAVSRLNQYIKSTYTIDDVFISDERILGTPETAGWTHLHAVLPLTMVNNSRVKDAYQITAEKREDRLLLLRALQEYPIDIVEQAVALLQTDSMYRGERILGIAEWFLNLHKSLAGTPSIMKNNLIWKAVAEAPAGFCHIKSSMIGSLLDDIKAGYSTRVIIARFEEKMNPQNYMRSQSAPTSSAIAQAEKLVEKLGIADSLRRRYARFDEIISKLAWVPKSESEVYTPKKPGGIGVFSHLTPKNASSSNDISLELPTTTMTWAKFSRTILPTAEKLEVKVDNPNRFMALVTEAVPGSENILQWDNPFSWYYHGGIDGEIKRRVEAAGGTYENCEIRCSLIWNSYTDLDLHCKTPHGYHIYYADNRDKVGGYLDVDANGGRGTTKTPVENIRWVNNAANGHYRFWVHNYYDRNARNNPYKVELEVGGKVYSCEGFLANTEDECLAFEFDYHNGIVSNLRMGNPGTESNSELWGLTMNSFVDVKGIVNSPNTWGDNKTTNGEHTFFILEGCKDTSEGKGRGFFNEILKPELREIRKTLELYSASTPIEGVDESDACGVGFNKDSEWNVVLRVTSNGNTRLIKIDRFD